MRRDGRDPGTDGSWVFQKRGHHTGGSRPGGQRLGVSPGELGEDLHHGKAVDATVVEKTAPPSDSSSLEDVEAAKETTSEPVSFLDRELINEFPAADRFFLDPELLGESPPALPTTTVLPTQIEA